MSFEQTSGWAALLLLLPYLLWLRRRRPLQRPVGGLEPFRQLAASGPGRRNRPPPSLWLFLCAYLLGTFALLGPQLDTWPSLLLEDRSASVLSANLAAPGDFDQVRVLGGSEQPISRKEILAALRQVSRGRPVTVWTDQEPPTDLPAWVDWRNQAFRGRTQPPGAILNALPVDAGHWRVHWALAAGTEAVLQVGEGWSSLVHGAAGSSLVPVDALPQVVSLRLIDPLGSAAPPCSTWLLQEVHFRLAPTVEEAWVAALLAVWPSAQVQRFAADSSGIPPAALVSMHVGDQKQPLPDSWSGLSWDVSPGAEEVALLARGWRVLQERLFPARDQREVLLRDQGTGAMESGFGSLVQTRYAIPRWIPWLVLVACACAALGWWWLPRPEPN